jgi:hypothetical protein
LFNHKLKKMRIDSDLIYEMDRQARLWAWGQRDWSTPSFGGHLNLIPARGGQIMPTM